jgi:hypothetical protein
MVVGLRDRLAAWWIGSRRSLLADVDRPQMKRDKAEIEMVDEI